MDADVIVVGAGLAGLVATAELSAAGKRVLVVDQESRQNLGGQAFGSLGGLLLVDSAEQRRMGIRDSHEPARQDREGTARFDRGAEETWDLQGARVYVDFAAGEKDCWLHGRGVPFPVVGWAERGDGRATGHGNSVPRLHVTWGTGRCVLEPFVLAVRPAESGGLVSLAFRHGVDGLLVEDGADHDLVRGHLAGPARTRHPHPARPVLALPGLSAAGEAAGFGGGGMHGYRALEGTFLGGCPLTGRVACRAVSEAVA